MLNQHGMVSPRGARGGDVRQAPRGLQPGGAFTTGDEPFHHGG